MAHVFGFLIIPRLWLFETNPKSNQTKNLYFWQKDDFFNDKSQELEFQSHQQTWNIFKKNALFSCRNFLFYDIISGSNQIVDTSLFMYRKQVKRKH